MAFEKINDFFKKLNEIDIYFFTKKPISANLLGVVNSFPLFICFSLICLILCLILTAIKANFISYIIIIPVMCVLFGLSSALFNDFILRNIDNKIEQGKRFFIDSFWKSLFKIDEFFLELNFVKKINNINKYYLKNRQFIFYFLFPIFYFPIIFLLLFFMLSINTLFLHWVKGLILFFILYIIFAYLFLLLAYFLLGTVLLIIDNFIKRNQPQSELKEENNNE